MSEIEHERRTYGYGKLEVLRANDHDAAHRATEWWETPDGQPLRFGLYYAVVLTRTPDSDGRTRTRWTFLSSGHETAEEALREGAGSPRREIRLPEDPPDA